MGKNRCRQTETSVQANSSHLVGGWLKDIPAAGFFSGKWLESLATMDTYIEAEYNTSKNHGESQCDTLNISECYPLVN